MARLIALLCLLLGALAGAPAAAQPAFPERGTAPVVDGANILDPAAEAQLSAALDAFEERNQRQFVVATVPSLDGYDIADYGYQLGRHWQLGDQENDDGILLLVAPTERKVRIEVGYGLEAILPDGLAYDIVEGEILPRFRAGDMTGGILAGADAVIRHLELPPEEARAIAAQAAAPQRSGEGFPIGALAWPLFLIFFFVIMPMFGRLRGGRRYRGGGVASGVGQVIMWSALNAAMNSGRGSGGGFGGGGFGGGGGGFGGGGFSGGGGSFGGGGASGSW